MLQQDEPDDYVLATGESHSIKDLLIIAFNEVGITDWEKYVKQDPKFYRPAEVDVLRGDSQKAKDKLGWKSNTSFEDLVRKMINNDIELLKRGVN